MILSPGSTTVPCSLSTPKPSYSLSRTAATRLQKAQSKFEHLAQVSRKEIASLLNRELRLRASKSQHDEIEGEKTLSVARLKAEKLMADDGASDLMEILERYCDVLLDGHLTERCEQPNFERRSLTPNRSTQLDATCLEAISGIVAASPRIDSSGTSGIF
jgi:hypothetical protein